MKEGWEKMTMLEACDLITCGVAARPKYVDDGIPFLSAKNVKEGQIIYEGYNCITEENHQELTKKNKPLVGDILYTRVGSYGEAAVIEEDIEFSVFVSLTLIKPKKELLNSYFLKYYLNSHEVKTLAKNSITSSGVGNLNVGTVRKFPIPIPPLPQQKQIVAILDKAFAAIDQAQANVEKNMVNAKELFQSKLNEIFSQKVDGWEEKVLGDIGVVQTGTTPSTKDKSNYGDYIPFAKPPHFKEDGSIDTQESMLSKSGLEKGRLFKANSILMVCIGATIGKTGFSEKPISSNQQINALTPSNDYVPKLLYYALISPFVQNQVMSVGKSAQATLPIINKSKWLKLKVNLPLDKSVQTQIIETLENLKEFCMNTETVYQQKLDNLEALKKSILQKAFSGALTSTSSATAKNATVQKVL